MYETKFRGDRKVIAQGKVLLGHVGACAIRTIEVEGRKLRKEMRWNHGTKDVLRGMTVAFVKSEDVGWCGLLGG